MGILIGSTMFALFVSRELRYICAGAHHSVDHVKMHVKLFMGFRESKSVVPLFSASMVVHGEVNMVRTDRRIG